MKALSIQHMETLQGGIQGFPIPIPMPEPGDPICGVLAPLSFAVGALGSAGLTISKPYCDQILLQL